MKNRIAPNSTSRSNPPCLARYVLVMTLLLLLGSSAASAQNSKGSWVTGPRADAIWNLMAQSPYAQAGDHGMVVYMISYSSCGNCIAFLRDFWESRRGDMQLREIFAPVNDPRYLNEAADIALTRSAQTAEAYYKRQQVAPPVSSSPARQAALQRVVDFNTRINTVFRQLGHVQDGYPTFVFRVKDQAGQDKLWIVSGWGDELARDMNNWVQQASR